MEAAEKGVYIDLLAHQHQKGFVPTEEKRLAKLCGMAVEQFLPLWSHVKQKFEVVAPGKLINKKLVNVVDDRKETAHKNKIIGAFAVLIRKSKLSAEQKEKIKKEFRVDDYLPFSTEVATERLTEWYNRRLPFLTITDTNTNTITNKDIGGVGEFVPVPDTVVGGMFGLWKMTFPETFVDTTEYQALLTIAEKITKWQSLSGDPLENKDFVLKRWGEILAHLKADSYLSKYSITQVNKHFSSVTQSFANGKKFTGTTGKPIPTATSEGDFGPL